MAQRRWAILIWAAAFWIIFTVVKSSESTPLVIVEHQGNSSYECITTARCLSCSLAEQQNEDIYHCSITGYYMPYKCVEIEKAGQPGENSKSDNKEKPVVKGGVQKNRKRLEEAEARKVFHINKSCTPYVPEDRLGVLGFEGIMLGMLAIFSPVLYYRKKRGFVVSGMTRIPTNVRF